MRLRLSARLSANAVWLSGTGMFAGTGLMLARTRASDRQLEDARQDGYDAGYGDGRDDRRVLRLVSSGVTPAFPVASAAGQLDQEVDVGDGADRVG